MQFQTAWQNLIEKLSGWLDSAILLLPNLALGIIVMGIALLLSRFLSRYANKLIYRLTENRTVSNVASSVAVAVFMSVALFVVLGILNLDTALTSLLTGAGVVGLAIGLALQDPLVNLFSGVMMSVRKMYNVGDLVETNGYFGTIREITLRATILSLPTGEQVTISNKEVMQNPLTNYTVSGNRKVQIDCGVGYDDDLEKVERVAIQTIEDLYECREENIDFFFTSFGDSSINFRLRFACYKHKNVNFLKAKSSAIKAIKANFDKHGINIPYPIRTLDIPRQQLETIKEINYADISQN